MAQLRHYNGSFGPRCPDGWRRVEVGEPKRKGDFFWGHDQWYFATSGHECVPPDGLLRIRRIAAAPVADAPATRCTECDRLQAQLAAAQRAREIAETACRSAESACAYHEGEAATAVAQRDAALTVVRLLSGRS